MNVTERIRALGVRMYPEYLLPAGAIVGLTLAAAGAFAPVSPASMKDAAVLVNGKPILKAYHDRVVEALAAGKRNPLDTRDEKLALERLIDEELLIQRSLELELHRTDAMARKRLVSAMLEWITADTAETKPTDDELRRFFNANQALFTPAGRIDVDWFYIARSEADGAARAEQTGSRLAAGQNFADAAKAGSPSALRVPDGLLPPAKLQDYLGPGLTRTALTLKPGEPAGPIARTDGWHFLLVRRREGAPTPEMANIREQVQAEYRRRKGDEAVRSYLEWLRRRAEIVYSGDTER